MKTHPFFLSTQPLAAVAAAMTLMSAQAQTSDQPVTETEATTEKTTEKTTEEVTKEATGDIATGRVFSVEPTSLLVTPANVSIPLTFTYNTKTPLMDEAEKSVPWDQIRAGLPVTVHYETHGEKLIATKVLVTRKMLTGGESADPDQAARKREMLAEVKRQKDLEAAERARTLPAAGGGTIMGFEQVITVRVPDSTDVVQYVVNNSTLYVDTAGQPVPLQFVRTGVPVSIQYVEDAGRRIATQFVVERIPRNVRDAANAAAARTGTATGVPGNAARATNSTGTISSTGQTTLLDQNGNPLPPVLEDGFLNPPVTVLPGATQQGTTTQAGTQASQPGAPGTAQSNQPRAGVTPNASQPNQPGASPNTPQPNSPQPGNTQPGTQPPGSRQPGTAPATPPRGASGTGNAGSRPGSSPGSSPGSAPGNSPGAAPASPR